MMWRDLLEEYGIYTEPVHLARRSAEERHAPNELHGDSRAPPPGSRARGLPRRRQEVRRHLGLNVSTERPGRRRRIDAPRFLGLPPPAHVGRNSRNAAWRQPHALPGRRRLHLPRRPEVRAVARHGSEAAAVSQESFFEHAEGTIFTAHRNGWCVGRCTAQIDRLHVGRYKEDCGFFGFLDTINDEEVARACSTPRPPGSGNGDEDHPRTVLPQHQRGDGLPGRGLRHRRRCCLMPHHRSYQGR